MLTHHAQQTQALSDFLKHTSFKKKGAVMLDLDGTVLYEERGVVRVPESIKQGLRTLHTLNKPIILNTLRFPLSIIRTIGKEWLAINEVPIPIISLNGSVIGHIQKTIDNELEFAELTSFPLNEKEMDEVIDGVEKLINAGLKDITLFYYPRDWKFGELIWTPDPNRIPLLEKKYTSCSAFVSTNLSKLRNELKRLETCMLFLLINAEGDQLMAYQHTHKHSYFTRKGVNKKFGAQQLVHELSRSLDDCIGAGDTELDTFLDGIGLSLQIGKNQLPYRGKHATLNLKDAQELGRLLEEIAQLSEKS